MKSDLKDQLELVHAVYEDACARCTAVVSDVRDLECIEARVKSEGMSFLTISLPNFCKDFEKSLAEGCVSASAFPYFRKTGAIPAFLQGMLGRLFDQETGRIIDFETDHPQIVQAVRQICLLFKKVELECSLPRRAQALANYLDVERLNSAYIPPGPDDSFYRVSDLLWSNVLAGFDPAALVPRHGPGAVVEGSRGNAKYLWQRWHERLEAFLPFWGNALPVRAHGEALHWTEHPSPEGGSILRRAREFEHVDFVSEADEQPVRVVFVPKTLKSPRVIAIEPMCMQYAQQALRDFFYTRLESHVLTRERVNFRDQSINQRIALTSSSTGVYATLDLSDASDRVTLAVVAEMLRSVPELRAAVLACRSASATLPNGVTIAPLSKFASMGSALCFPIEAMYFYAVCVDALLAVAHLPVTWESVRRVSRDIRVYGDDLIVPSEHAVAVTEHLQKYNCKVNANKSFWTGRFRESCGVDGFAGIDVTPLYLRHLRPSNRRHTRQILSWVASANAFSQRGYDRTAHFMYRTIEGILGPLPEVPRGSGVIGKVAVKPWLDRNGPIKWRYNPLIQRVEVLVWMPASVKKSQKITGYPALQKCLLKLEHGTPSPGAFQAPQGWDPMFTQWADREVPWTAGDGWSSNDGEAQISPSDSRHLERDVVRGALTLKRRWIPFNT